MIKALTFICLLSILSFSSAAWIVRRSYLNMNCDGQPSVIEQVYNEIQVCGAEDGSCTSENSVTSYAIDCYPNSAEPPVAFDGFSVLATTYNDETCNDTSSVIRRVYYFNETSFYYDGVALDAGSQAIMNSTCSADGVMQLTVCPNSDSECHLYTLTSECNYFNLYGQSAHQTGCNPTTPVAEPVSAPVSAPATAPTTAPTTAPVSSPVSVPVKAPVAKSSSAVSVSVGLASAVVLLVCAL